MRKVFCFAAILVLAVLSVHAYSISFVYGSSISSIDMPGDVKVGQVYVDQNSNVLVVRSVLEDVDYGADLPGRVVELDKIISRGEYVASSSLRRRGPLSGISIYSGLYHSLASYRITCALYPLYPVVMTGVGYDLIALLSDQKLKYSGALALAGVGVSFPIARLWDSKSTLIENGKISAWCAPGIRIADSVTFALSYGFSYRHNAGSFHWEVGGMWLYKEGVMGRISPYLGFGVDI